MKPRWTRDAVADLRAKRDFVAQYDPKAANAVARRLYIAAQEIAGQGDRWPLIDEVSLRKRKVGDYVILYEFMDSVVTIARIRHAPENWRA